jgi:hypothetical protein
MPYSDNKNKVNELWAVIKDGCVMWSRGGSSSRSHLMVFQSKESAERTLKNPWIKQIIKDRQSVTIECVYRNEKTPIQMGEWVARACKNYADCPVKNKNLHCYETKPCFD